jgi:hypothetical protein
MPYVLAALSLAVQIYFIVHVFRTGRPYWWAFIILSAPVVGSLAYYLVEVMPGSREERKARRAVQSVVRSFKPDAELKRRAQELEICGSIDNKLALAEECEACGMFEEAARLYESALSGPYARDANIRFRLARALLDDAPDQARARRALELATAIATDKPDHRPGEVRLLQARALHVSGDLAGAAALYEQLVAANGNLETRTRYGLLLHDMGHLRQAEETLKAVDEHARRFNIQHEEELAWVDRARAALKP